MRCPHDIEHGFFCLKCTESQSAPLSPGETALVWVFLAFLALVFIAVALVLSPIIAGSMVYDKVCRYRQARQARLAYARYVRGVIELASRGRIK